MGVVVLFENIIYGKNWARKLEYRCYFTTEEAHVGDVVELVEEVVNGKLLPLPWMKSELTASNGLDFAETQSSVTDKSRFVSSFFMLKSYHKISRRWRVKCLKRGIFKIDTVVLVASNLFGTMNLSNPVTKDMTGGELRVLPAPCDEALPQAASSLSFGDVFVRRQLISDPFFHNGVREYDRSDNIRRISWKITAKEQRLMVYNEDYTTNQSAAVLLNMQSREYEKDSVYDENALEQCINACAGIIYDSLDKSIPVMLMSNTSLTDNRKEPVLTPLYSGAEHARALLRILSRIELMNTESFAPFLESSLLSLEATDIFIVTAYVNERILLLAQENSRIKIVLAGAANDNLADLTDSISDRMVRI
jgi:uncharacterized protein (DUF58 family)